MAKILELLKQKLAVLYFFLEEKYYRAMDFLNDKLKIPVYKYYVNPIESRGVPSFPVTIGIIVVIIILLLLLLLGGAPPEESKLTVIVQSGGHLLENANVIVLDGGNELASKQTIAGKALFAGLPLKSLLIKASKPNFSPASKTIDFTKQKAVTLELGCVTEACAKEIGVTPTPPPVFPTPSIPAWDKDPDAETAKAKLIVQVRSAANASARPNAAVSVYEANSDTNIGDSATTNGDAVFQDLETGMKVYVMVDADGYIPYDGSKKTKALVKGTNTIEVKLFPLIACPPNSNDSACKTNYATSTIVVRETNETPIASAKVSIYNASNPGAPLYKDKSTDSNGTFKANLSIEGDYYAVVTKTKYFTEASSDFKAGDNIIVVLTRITPETTANLTANTFDLDNEAVTGASIAVFSLNATGQTIKLGEKNTGNYNYAIFQELRRGISVRVNASKTSQFGASELNLSEAANNVTVRMSLLNATIIARAKNLFTGDLIAGVEFKAFKNGVLLASCITGGADNTCVLAVNAKKLLAVNASKAGFQPNPWTTTLTLQPDQTYALNASMASEEDLSDVQVFPSDPFLVDAFSQEPVSTLKLGHSYTARFQLISKTDANLQSSGMHLRLEPLGNAFITGNSPLAPQQLAGTTDEKSGCSGLENADYSSGKKYAWVDLTWGGAKTYAVAINFTVSTDAKLNETTKVGVLQFKHRAFGKKNDGTFVRNPFDSRLGTQPDAPLESGCNAEANSNETKIVNPGATCGKGFCAYLRFHQFDQEGNEGFNASNNSMLLAFYKIEVFQPLQDYTRLLYAVSSQFLQVYNVSIPIPADGGIECGAGKQNVFDPQWLSGAKAVSVNLSNLTKCFNYPPLKWPYVFEGTVYGRPIQTSDKVNVTLSIATAPSPSEVTESNELNHSTWFSISGGPERQPVEITFKLKQEGYKETTSETQTRQLDGEALAKDNWAACDYYPGCKTNASDVNYKTNWSVCSKYSWNSQQDSYAFQTLSGIPGSYAGFAAFGIAAVGPDYQVPADSKNKPIELTFSLKANENVYGGKLKLEVPEKWPVWGVNPDDLYYYPKGCAIENASIEYPAPMLDPTLGNDETQHPNRSMKWRCDASSPTGAPANAADLISFVKSQGYNADDCRQFVKIFNATVGGTTYQADAAKSFVEIPVGDLEKDAVVTGKAYVLPLVPEDKPLYGWRSGVVATFNGSFSKEFLEPATAHKSQYVGRYCDTITGRDCAPEDIKDTDGCFYLVYVNYTDDKGLRVLLNADENGIFADVSMEGMYNCKGIKFWVGTGASWLVVNVNSSKTLLVNRDPDSENPDAESCYQSAKLNTATGKIEGSWSAGLSTGFSRPGVNVVRFMTENCPTQYKMWGNTVEPTSLGITIEAQGVSDPKKKTANVTLTSSGEWIKERYKTLYIGPVATTYLHNSDGSIDKNYGAPQLWSIINNRQWGAREFKVKITGGSASAEGIQDEKTSIFSYTLDKPSAARNTLQFLMPGDGGGGDGDGCWPECISCTQQNKDCDPETCECIEEPSPTPTVPGGGGGKAGIPPEKTSVTELPFTFEGPGAQFFTYAPTPGSKLQFYEIVDGEEKEITYRKGGGDLPYQKGTYVTPYNFNLFYKDMSKDPDAEGYVATPGNAVYDETQFPMYVKDGVYWLVHKKWLARESMKINGKTYGPWEDCGWFTADGECTADWFQPINVMRYGEKNPLNLPRLDLQECTANEKYSGQGILLLHYSLTEWKGEGQGDWTAEVVHAKQETQFGYACSKGDEWNDVELCAPTYADFSRFGACWNTLNSDVWTSKMIKDYKLAQANFIGRFTGGSLIPAEGNQVLVSPGGFVILAKEGAGGGEGNGACITTDNSGGGLTAPDYAQCWLKSTNGLTFELFYPNGTIQSPKDSAQYIDSNPDLYSKLTSGGCPACKQNGQPCDCEGNPNSGLPACDPDEPMTAAQTTFGLCNNHHWELSADASSVFWTSGVNCEGAEPKSWSDMATLALGNCVKQTTVQTLDCENKLDCLTSAKEYSGNKVLGPNLKLEGIDCAFEYTGAEGSDVEPFACSFMAPGETGDLKSLWGTFNANTAPATHKCFKNTPGECAPCYYASASDKTCVQTADAVDTTEETGNPDFGSCYHSSTLASCPGGQQCIVNPDCSQPA